MPTARTQKTPVDWADRFEAEYPETTAAGLAWLERKLKLDRKKMIRLGGLEQPSFAEKSLLPTAFWSSACRRDPERADNLEELLTGLIHLFDYDWSEAAKSLRDRGDPSPAMVALPLPKDIPPDAALLVAIHSRSPGWSLALIEFLRTAS